MNQHHYVAIMAGGIGSRFWPKSRTSYPKQFLDILNTGKTLIQWTFDRFATFIPAENIYVVTSEEYVPIVLEQLPGINAANVLAEPDRKNTAPCVAYIAHKLLLKDPEASLIVAPSDHMVLDPQGFEKVALQALNFANETGSFVTLGIKPTYANTGYGYIQHEQAATGDNIYKVKNFVEKPNLEKAQEYIASGDYLWNAGIFIWQAQQVVKAFEQYQPQMNQLFVTESANFNSGSETDAIARIYSVCENISIDYALMEKADNVYVIPSSFGWSDLGTWNSAYENLAKDEHNNAIAGDNVMVVNSKNCMVSAPHDKLLLLQGMEDCIVVDTTDALLICKKDKEQEIKQYVSEVKRTRGVQYL